MTHPVKHISSQDVLAAAKSPLFRLLSALCSDDPAQISSPKEIQTVLKWTRSYKSDDPQFSEKQAVEIDYRHLGFFDETGEQIPELVAIGRKFIKAHSTEPPQYSRLWRHIQSHLGKVQKETKDADFTEYNTHIAELIDHGEGSVAIAKAVVLADQNGMAVPTSPLCQADRFRIIQASVPENQRALMTKALDEREFNWFSLDNVASSIRHLLKDQNYGLGEDEVNAWLDENGTPSLTRQIKAMFGNRSKAQNLRDLGLLGENWQWSEVGFQRHRVILEEAIESGCEPNFEWLRWETHQRHNSDQPFPFKWALMNESLPQAVLHRARRLASIALSGGMVGDSVKVGQIITPEQYKVLRKIGAWISDPLIYDQQDNLLWLGVLAKQPGVNWQNWEQVCSFVSDKLDQVPDRELLRAWQEGTVTFEGTGRYRQNPATPFVGVKVGRNDQCPCGSNKKFKKCCGM